MTTWAAGERVGPFTLLSRLGAGGMGEVWKARDDRLDRFVAIKRLVSHDQTRFQQEARAIAALNHPHICQIYDVGPDYLVMEYVEGSPPSGPMRSDDALRLSLQIASALEEAHGKRILHRDLKPSNILVTAAGTAKLLDFGLARLISKSGDTQTTAVMGTPLYSSPEQMEGRPLDERSDVFSFGAVLYEMLSGRRAFDSLAAVLRDHPAALDAPGSEIAARCLAKKPGDRFHTITEVREALQRLTMKPTSDQPSIAVLPFANMSADKDQEFFSDGLAEEIINALAQIPGLKVTARTSAFAFRGKEQDVRAIASALDVRTILEGSVRRSGTRLRVTAQLINAADGYHLWSQRYDREMADVFDVQDEIAAAITAALQVKLTSRHAPAERYRPNIPAYEAFLKARHFFNSAQSMDAWERSRALYEEAIALDPKFAGAYGDLAGHYNTLAVIGLSPPGKAIPRAKELARQALALEPSLADAHALLGIAAAMFEYEWVEAGRQFEAIIAADTLSPAARIYCGVYLLAMGRWLHATEHFMRAVSEDPLFPFYRMWLGLGLWASGRSGEAVREFRHTLEQDLPGGYVQLALYHASREEWLEALPYAQKAHKGSPLPHNRGILAALLARTGDTATASEMLDRLGPLESYGVPRALTMYHLIMGDGEKAADAWDKMVDQQDPFAVMMPRMPYCAPLRASSRWLELSKRLKLPAGAAYS